MIYKCPKCERHMVCISTASLPPRYFYRCLSCGFESKVISGSQEIMTLPKKWWSEEKKDEVHD